MSGFRQGIVARLFGTRRDSTEALLDRIHGRSGPRYASIRSGAAIPVPPGASVLAAWAESATEPRARALIPPTCDTGPARRALASLCAPSACLLVEEEALAEGDPRLAGPDLRAFFPAAPRSRRHRKPAVAGSPGADFASGRDSAASTPVYSHS